MQQLASKIELLLDETHADWQQRYVTLFNFQQLEQLMQQAMVINGDPIVKFSVSLSWADEDFSAQLNHQYRKKNKPTNVLSFPMLTLQPIDDQSEWSMLTIPDFNLTDSSLFDLSPPLGDIVVCLAVVEKEAQQQNKSFQDHLSHLLIHGMLHLQGYDHSNDTDAEIMEALEVNLLSQLGINNPY